MKALARLAVGAFAASATTHAAPAAAGLLLRIEGGGATDTTIASNAWLRVEGGASPSPFIQPGPFTAVWTGTISIDLRGDYQFQAAFDGSFDLEINGTNILRSATQSGITEWSRNVRLRKGANSLRATLVRATTNVADLQIRWKGRGVPVQPIANDALAPNLPGDAEQGIAQSEARRMGRGLFLDYRCGRCHAPSTATPVPELSMDAPSFDGMGSRRRTSWLARWIANPSEIRPSATMPRLLNGPGVENEARAIATWLSTLKSSTPGVKKTNGNPAVGRVLFGNLQCTACHSLPAESDPPDKISLKSTGPGFADGALTDFLLRPDRHFAWTPMPNFHLTEEEAADLSAALLEQSPPHTEAEEDADVELVIRGRELVQSKGCLNCHAAAVENHFHAKPLGALPPPAWVRGCLAVEPDPASPAPHYSMSPEERGALREFAVEIDPSLGRHVPAEFAERWMSRLRCHACHDTIEGIPSLHNVGEKLRPEWLTRLFMGEVSYKPRPWLQARMPAFPAFATLLPAGLAAAHGLPPRSPEEPDIDMAAAEDGRKLASASGGFSCVSCHAIGPMGASAVFEAPGVNFVHSGERLLPDYFFRWVTNPQAIDPVTKMPLYFDEEGNSALTDFYGGDGPRTIHALWSYVRLGSKMLPPPP